MGEHEEHIDAIKKVMLWVMMADGYMDEEEVKQIAKVYKKLTQKDLDPATIRMEGESIQYINLEKSLEGVFAKLNLKGRKLVLQAAMLVAAADGEFQIEEQILVSGLVKKLQLEKAEADAIVKQFFNIELAESIEFECPNCYRKAFVKKEKNPFGKKTKCKGCQETFELSKATMKAEKQEVKASKQGKTSRGGIAPHDKNIVMTVMALLAMQILVIITHVPANVLLFLLFPLAAFAFGWKKLDSSMGEKSENWDFNMRLVFAALSIIVATIIGFYLVIADLGFVILMTVVLAIFYKIYDKITEFLPESMGAGLLCLLCLGVPIFFGNIYQSRLFYKAKSAGTIEAYEAYLDAFPKGNFHERAEGRLWQIIQGKNTTLHYESYIEKYPHGKYVPLAEKTIWNMAVSKKTIAAYEKYIDKYPNASYVPQAQKKIKYYKESLTNWDKVVALDKISAYRNYAKKYSDGLRISEALKYIKEYEKAEKIAWGIATTQKTVSFYESYIEKFPDEKHVADAKKGIWKATVAKKTIAAYKYYLKKYPDSQHVSQAKKQIEYYKKSLAHWDKVVALDKISAYKDHLKKYPNTPRFTQALEKIWKAVVKENKPAAFTKFRKEFPDTKYDSEAQKRDWSWVKRINTIKAYKAYLACFPNDPRKKQIKKRIIDLQVSAISKGNYGRLSAPPLVKTKRGKHASITIKNATSYTLTVLYSGPDSQQVVLAVGQTKTVRLLKGRYQVAASVSSASVTSFYGSANLQGYHSSQFYIRTRFK